MASCDDPSERQASSDDVQTEQDHELDLEPEFMLASVRHRDTKARDAQTRFVQVPPRPADRQWSAPNGAG